MNCGCNKTSMSSADNCDCAEENYSMYDIFPYSADANMITEQGCSSCTKTRMSDATTTAVTVGIISVIVLGGFILFMRK